MFQFFVEENQISLHNLETIKGSDSSKKEGSLGQVFIEGEDVNHIKNVLRMKADDRIRVSTKEGSGYFCHIVSIDDSLVEAAIDSIDEVGTELPCKITLFQGLPKGDKMELIIQKCTELGVSEIVPVAMKNCVVKLDEKRAKNKVSRWNSIAESAAKQSKRSIIPLITEVMAFKEAVKYAENMDVKLVPYENEEGMVATKRAFEDVKAGDSVAIFIGPEGGFDEKEIDLVRDDMQLISLGRRILRTETAGLTTLSILMYHLELGM